MSDLREMYADLVRAAGLEPAFDETCDRLSLGIAIDRARFIVRDRAAAARAHGHFHPRFRIAADRLVDRALARIGNTPDEGEIATLEPALAAMIGELRRERAMRAIGLGDNQQAAGVLV